ncbi:hypothetical protein [Dictyobacter kobayashii]|uniref:General stress protein 17M-like domain-containing protein n=1 Tax=Dictyobacter kobayashii TaxID=2014872 RepID=A0A402AJJ6_9CHLR|nr:hypothetical protein [Dictyobacter kobayashii]GCE19225.1 hypothetical protein KDK_30250 [Dictyobacter kobayashii]
MTTYQTPLVIGIFQDEVQAKNAVDALRNAGFRYDQVGVAIHSSNNATPDLQADLVNLGVSEEQASFYDEAYKAGKIVVSIRHDGREDEVQDILTNNGAYDYNHRESVATANTTSTTPETQPAEPGTEAQDSATTEPEAAADAQDSATTEPEASQNSAATSSQVTEE